jgi:hypothetical protein
MPNSTSSISVNDEGSYGAICYDTGLTYISFSDPTVNRSAVVGTILNVRACAISNVQANGHVNVVALNAADGVNYLYKVTDITGAPVPTTVPSSALSTALYSGGGGGVQCVSCDIDCDSAFDKFIIAVHMSSSQDVSTVPNSLFMYDYSSGAVTVSNTLIGYNWINVTCDTTGMIVTATHNSNNNTESICLRSNDGGHTFYEVVLNKFDVSYSKYVDPYHVSKKVLITGAACDDSGFNISLSVGTSAGPGSFGFLIQDVIQFDDKTYIHLLKEYVAATKSSSAHQQAAMSVNNLKLYPGNL